MSEKFQNDSAAGNVSVDQFSHQSFEKSCEESDVVVASRIRLHRNIADHSFVGVSEQEQLDAVNDSIQHCIGRWAQLEDIPIANGKQLREIESQFLLDFRAAIEAAEALADSSPGGDADQLEFPASEFEVATGSELATGSEGVPLFGDLKSESLDRLESLFFQRVADATSLAETEVTPDGISDEDFFDIGKTPSHEISVSINDEDHLRTQVVAAGYPMDWMWRRISQIDDQFEQSLTYAFSPRWGYLSASPANLGTGMRATVLLHLPGLATLGKLDNLFLGLMREGIVGRGVYGEDAWGDFFCIGNQVTLGRSEQELMQLVRSVVPAIVDYEREARKLLFQQYRDEMLAQTSDALRALKLQVRRADEELLALISSARLGIALGLVSNDEALELRSHFELTRLKRKLEVAVTMEHYSSATKYRDQIRQLEQRRYGH